MVQQTKLSEDEFVWKQTHRIPKVYKNVIEIVYQQHSGYVDYRRKYKLNCRKLLNLKYQLGIYIRYMRYYYHHKDEIDLILKKTLVARHTQHKHKYNIFMSLLKNPFRKSGELEQLSSIAASSTVRTVMNQAKALLKNIAIIKPLLNDFNFIVFGQLRRGKMREVFKGNLDENLKDALSQVDWLLPKPSTEISVRPE